VACAGTRRHHLAGRDLGEKGQRPGHGRIDDLVVLLGVTDMTASKQFYVDRGLTVARSFGRKYVEFDLSNGPIKLALYGRRALAKVAGVSAEGTGSHRLAIGTDAGDFTDPTASGGRTRRLPAAPPAVQARRHAPA
jgi:hypothetical protein